MTTENKKHDAAKIAVGMLIRLANNLIEEGETELEKFTKELQGKDPAYAFRWAHRVMAATASADVARSMKRKLEDQGDEAYQFIWGFRDHATEAVIGKARHPEFSTSPTSNLMFQFETAAIARWVETLNHAVMHLEANGLTRMSTTDEA